MTLNPKQSRSFCFDCFPAGNPHCGDIGQLVAAWLDGGDPPWRVLARESRGLMRWYDGCRPPLNGELDKIRLSYIMFLMYDYVKKGRRDEGGRDRSNVRSPRPKVIERGGCAFCACLHPASAFIRSRRDLPAPGYGAAGKWRAGVVRIQPNRGKSGPPRGSMAAAPLVRRAIGHGLVGLALRLSRNLRKSRKSRKLQQSQDLQCDFYYLTERKTAEAWLCFIILTYFGLIPLI